MAGEDKISRGEPPAVLLSHRTRPGSPAATLWIRPHSSTAIRSRVRCVRGTRSRQRGVSVPSTDFAIGMKCRVCGKLYPKSPINFCTDDFGPLEVAYDYDASAGRTSRRAKIETRPRNMWRYRELLPLDGEPTVGPQVGGTPLDPRRPPRRRARRRAAVDQERRGQLPDAVVQGPRRRRWRCRRPASSASGRSAAPAPATSPTASPPTPPAPGSRAFIFVPADLERAKILGTARLRREGDRRHRHLRRGEPPLHADRAQVRLGLREREPAAVLRRRLEDVRLRDRRGPRLAVPAARRLPDGRRQR